MRYLILVCICLTHFGCSITGEYLSGDGFNNQTLKIQKGHRFTYQYFQDIGGTTNITGVWSKKNDFVILNSDAKPSFIPNSIITSINKSLPRKLIVIQNMDVTTGDAIILLNGNIIDTAKTFRFDEIYYQLINDSVLAYPITGLYTDISSVKSIKILKNLNWTDCGFTQNEFQIQDTNSNYIKVFTKPYNQYYGMKFFYDTKWLVKGKRIYYWRNENNNFKKKRYLKRRNK